MWWRNTFLRNVNSAANTHTRNKENLLFLGSNWRLMSEQRVIRFLSVCVMRFWLNYMGGGGGWFVSELLLFTFSRRFSRSVGEITHSLPLHSFY